MGWAALVEAAEEVGRMGSRCGTQVGMKCREKAYEFWRWSQHLYVNLTNLQNEFFHHIG